MREGKHGDARCRLRRRSKAIFTIFFLSPAHGSVKSSVHHKRKPTMASVLTIGIAGGTCSGKSTLAERLVAHVGAANCVCVGLDEFYRQQPDEVLANGTANFDRPEAFDFEAFVAAIDGLRQGLDVVIPKYDRSISRIAGTTTIEARPVLFIDVDPAVQRTRRMSRDIDGYGRSAEVSHNRYEHHVNPAFVEFVAPTKANAHLVLSGTEAIELSLQRCLARLERTYRPNGTPLLVRGTEQVWTAL
jgi:uridine kinase